MVLPQQHRLRGHRFFDRLYREGRRYHGPSMVLRVLPATPPGERPSPWRCGVVVSSKVSKRAVRRNRLRRLLHGHLLRQSPAAAAPFTLLISLKPGSADLSPEVLLGECTDLLRKAGLSDGPGSPSP